MVVLLEPLAVRYGRVSDGLGWFQVISGKGRS